MSVTVLSEGLKYSFFNFEKQNGVFHLRGKAWIALPIIHNGMHKELQLTFEGGFICDGLSVPFFLRWFLKNWDDKNELYNLAGVVHDALYGHKGFNIFNREECDDIFRGMLRISGQNRAHASTADFFLGLFAGPHWGTDEYHCNDKVSLRLT